MRTRFLILTCLLASKYVLKQIDLRKSSKRDILSAQQEAHLLKRLKHPNIVSYKESFETGGILHIVMLYCDGGDLYTQIKQRNGHLIEETQVVEWFVQIAMALQVSRFDPCFESLLVLALYYYVNYCFV